MSAVAEAPATGPSPGGAPATSAVPPMFAPPPEQVDRRTWIAVLAGLLGAFMAVLDIQITNASLRDILGTLSATQEEGSWIATSYLVAEIIVIPLTALLSTAFGLRRYLIATVCAFLAFSIACGAAWNLESMIVFRALQGLSGGGLIPLSMAIVLRKLPLAKRPIGLAAFGMTATLAPTIGPTIGGWLTGQFGWPSIFYINALPSVLLVAGIWYGLDREPIRAELLARADKLGIALMALGLGSLTVFLEEGNSHDWLESDFVRMAGGLALVGLVGWVVTALSRPDPFVNLRLFGRRNFGSASLIAATTGMALYGSAFILPLFLGQIPQYDAEQIGEVMMWVGLPQLFLMPFAATVSAKVDNRIVASVGLALFAASCFMNTDLSGLTGRDQLIFSQVVRALGQPFIMITLSTFATNGIALQDMASASSLFNMARNLGGSIGIASLATLLTRREQFHSARLVEATGAWDPATQDRLAALAQSFQARGLDAAAAADHALRALELTVRREAFTMAYNDAFLVMGWALVACILVVWLSDPVRGGAAGGGH